MLNIINQHGCVSAQSLSCVQLFATPLTVAHQAPLSMGFSRQEYWSGLPCLPPGDLPKLEIELVSLMSPALEGRFLPLLPPGKPLINVEMYINQIHNEIFHTCQNGYYHKNESQLVRMWRNWGICTLLVAM